MENKEDNAKLDSKLYIPIPYDTTRYNVYIDPAFEKESTVDGREESNVPTEDRP